MLGLLVLKQMYKVAFKEWLLTEITTSITAVNVTVNAAANYFYV